MTQKGRPALSELEKVLRKGKRTWIKIKELEELLKTDPDGPVPLRSAGRPPVKYTTQLLRLNEEYAEIKSAARALADIDNDAQEIEKKILEVEDPTIGSTVGRPKALDVQEIEYKIRVKQARIQRIRAGAEPPQLKTTKSGKLLGRAPISGSEKISRLEDQVLALQAEARVLESQMTPNELEDLAIRRLRRVASKIRGELKDEGLDELRIEAHKNWEQAKADRDKFGAKVLEAVALERTINERATKLKNRGYTPRD